jgi:23S rRNA (guanosine2251-2'-O)-methyltransferase
MSFEGNRDNTIYGRNPVIEAINSGREIDKILIQKNIEGAGKKVYALAKKAKIPTQSVDKAALDRAAGVSSHQGVVASVSEYVYSELDDILLFAEARGEPPFIVLLDGIEDPHNLGAIIRSCDGAGAHGVVIPKHRAASVTGAVIKTSAGAALHMPVARVTNIGAAIDELKEKGVWIYGLDMDGQDYGGMTFDGATALVIGSEGSGVSRLVKERCDFIVSLPMRGQVSSLNASNAAAILLYEIARQRNTDVTVSAVSPDALL